jgi:hypothetical protein
LSYLSPIRLHFAGQFQADPSTVNNDVRHFDNATFKPNFQQPGRGTTNGWWNPDGTGSFRLVGCTVQSVAYGGASGVADPIVGMQIADANSKVAGKIVDLDPQQQMVSQIWGMIVRLSNGKKDLFSGAYAPSPFTDMWGRATGPGASGDNSAGVFWQSVIGPVTWGDVSGSPFLQILKAAAPDGLLSIKFNVDGYNLNSSSPTFTLGRCVGTIGPACPTEPKRFVIGRQLLPQIMAGVVPQGEMFFMQAVVDPCCGQVLADFGNAIPTSAPNGPLADIGTLELGWVDPTKGFQSIGAVNYLGNNWYPTTAGVQAYPVTPAQLAALLANPMAVAQNGSVLLQENTGGLYVRADEFVFRLNPGETAPVQLYATQYGVPMANAPISVAFDPNGLSPGVGNDPASAAPPYAEPANAITFPTSVTADVHGRATLSIGSSDPGNPRGYIDGQVYGVRCLPQATATAIGNPPPILAGNPTTPTTFGVNPSDFISLLVWDAYNAPADLRWFPQMQPIFQQYGNLYPFMDTMIDLTSYQAVAKNAKQIAAVFSLPRTDPHYMPVTRDLSAAKSKAAVQWLTTKGPNGLPPQGTGPKKPKGAALAATAPVAEPSQEDPMGAKTLAMKTRGWKGK